MFSFRRPSEGEIREYLSRQGEAPLSYDCAECTRGALTPRRGWNIDHERVLLGHGEAAFRRASAAIEQWRMFPQQIATLYWPEQPHVGLVVGVLYWAAPVRMWILFPTRVVYVIRDTVGHDGRLVERFGFAYGTLPDHPERGEERFLIEWDHADNSVWYDLRVFSQPAHWLARVGYIYTRWEQARFRRLSGEAMQSVCRA